MNKDRERAEMHWKLRRAFMTERDICASSLDFNALSTLAGRWALTAVDFFAAVRAKRDEEWAKAAREVLRYETSIFHRFDKECIKARRALAALVEVKENG